MKRTQLYSFLLAIFTCSAPLLSACGDSAATTKTPETTSSQKSSEAITETETDDNRIPSALPNDLDYEGNEVTVWYFTKNSDAAEHFYDLQGDAEGDIIENALYDRNLAVEEQLNIKINYVDTGIASSDVGTNIRKLLMANDDTYDLYNVIQWNSSALALEHLFMNVSDVPYIDLKQPWWSKNYIDALSIGSDSVYFITGDISLDMVRCIGSVYYNKNLYANYFDDANGLYQYVLDGSWTIDMMTNIVRECYADLNGDGQVNEGDQFGLISNTYNNIDAFTFGMGAKFTDRDNDNLPYLTVADVHNQEVYDKMYTLGYETVGTLTGTSSETLANVQMFSNGLSMFLPGFLYTSENLRDMKDDYGIIPFPKYDETQENYISAVHDIATLMCLPTNCKQVDTVCAMLEAMAYYSYYHVTPVYYETALKAKYTRDDTSSQIIDILHDASMTDLAYVYDGSLNGAGMIMRSLFAAKNKDYSSYYAKREKGTIKKMEKFIENFLESKN